MWQNLRDILQHDLIRGTTPVPFAPSLQAILMSVLRSTPELETEEEKFKTWQKRMHVVRQLVDTLGRYGGQMWLAARAVKQQYVEPEFNE